MISLKKKGSANMWWIIIGAVIALVVMIILLVMFTGRGRDVESGLSACETKSGICINEQGNCPIGTLNTPGIECTGEKLDCCIGIPKKCSAVGQDGPCGDGNICAMFSVNGKNKHYCIEN